MQGDKNQTFAVKAYFLRRFLDLDNIKDVLRVSLHQSSDVCRLLKVHLENCIKKEQLLETIITNYPNNNCHINIMCHMCQTKNNNTHFRKHIASKYTNLCLFFFCAMLSRHQSSQNINWPRTYSKQDTYSYRQGNCTILLWRKMIK